MTTLPIRSILLATELGESSERSIRAAGELAFAAGAALHVVHAFDLEPLPTLPGAESAALPTFQGRLHSAQEALDEHVRRFVHEEVDVASRRIVIWTAHRAILERAAEVAADLIILGPHRGGGLGAVLGGTADRVLREATAPCLVVRGPGLHLPLRRIVVGTDLSTTASAGTLIGGIWADGLGADEAELHIVYVASELTGMDEGSFDRSVSEHALEDACARVAAEAEIPARVTVRPEVVWGPTPAETLAEYAEGVEADLLVVGTHARGPVGRALLGSVASGVARRAHCPVLLVPPGWSADRGAP